MLQENSPYATCMSMQYASGVFFGPVDTDPKTMSAIIKRLGKALSNPSIVTPHASPQLPALQFEYISYFHVADANHVTYSVNRCVSSPEGIKWTGCVSTRQHPAQPTTAEVTMPMPPRETTSSVVAKLQSGDIPCKNSNVIWPCNQGQPQQIRGQNLPKPAHGQRYGIGGYLHFELRRRIWVNRKTTKPYAQRNKVEPLARVAE